MQHRNCKYIELWKVYILIKDGLINSQIIIQNLNCKLTFIKKAY